MRNEIFNTIIETGKANGLKVFSAIKVQCPVWVIHLKMSSRDNDPFFPVDKGILSLLEENPWWKPAQIASFIGMDASFINGRIKALTIEGMLYKDDSGRFRTDNAYRKYFNENGERPIVTIYDDLVLDGYSLKPLDKEFYASKALYSSRRSEMVVPRVIMGKDDPALVRAVKQVEKLNGKEKESLQLDHDSFDYEIEGFEAKSIDNVYVVLAINTGGKKGERKVFYKDRFLSNVDSLASTLDNYYLSIRESVFHCSCGFMPQEGNPFVAMTIPSIEDYIAQRYEMKEVSKRDYMYTPHFAGGNEYPLSIVVSEEMLERSENPRKLMDDALLGRVIEYTKEGTFKHRIGGYFWIPVYSVLGVKLSHYKALRSWQKENGRVDISFIRSLEPAWKNWRKDFVRLGLLGELESIDVSQFIDDNRMKEDDYE